MVKVGLKFKIGNRNKNDKPIQIHYSNAQVFFGCSYIVNHV